MNFFKTFKNNNLFLYYLILFLISITPLLVSNFFLFLKDPAVFPDEPVFFDMARNISFKGFYTADIYVGTIKEVAESGLGYPPLYFYLLNLWSSIFGSTIESVRSMSFILGLICLLLFFLITKEVFKSDKFALIGTLLLSANIHFARAARLGRMEILAFLFLVISSLFLILAWKRKKKVFYTLSGFGAAGAVLSHPLGIMVTPIMLLTTLITEKSLKDKVTLSFWTGIPVILAFFSWIIIQSERIPAILSTYPLLFSVKSGKPPYAWILFQNDFSWWLLFIIDFLLISIFIYTFIKTKSRLNTFILIGLLISIFLALFNIEAVYLIYPQFFITLALLSCLSAIEYYSDFLKKSFYILTGLLLLSFIIIQFFNNNNLAVTRPENRSIFSTRNYDYHKLTAEIIENLPKDKKTHIFIAAFPDPYFDLLKNPNFTIYEAPDPTFPLSEENYKRTLDQSDYIVLTWMPHKFLDDYINKNIESKIEIGTPDSYYAVLVKLLPKDKRKSNN